MNQSHTHKAIPGNMVNHHNTVSLSESNTIRNNGSYCGLSINGQEYRSSSATSSSLDNNKANSMDRRRNKSNSFSVSIPERKDSTYFVGNTNANVNSGTPTSNISFSNNSRNDSFRKYSTNSTNSNNNELNYLNNSFMSSSSSQGSAQIGSKEFNNNNNNNGNINSNININININNNNNNNSNSNGSNINNNNNILPDNINDVFIAPRNSSYSNSLRNASLPIDIPCSNKSSDSDSDSLSSSFSSYRSSNYVISTSQAAAESILSESRPHHDHGKMDEDPENDHDLIFDLEHTTSIPRSNSNEKEDEAYKNFPLLVNRNTEKDFPVVDRDLLNSSTAFSSFLDSYSNILNSFKNNSKENNEDSHDSILSLPLSGEDTNTNNKDSKSKSKSKSIVNEETNVAKLDKSNSKVQRNPSTLMGFDIEVEKELLKKRNTLKSKDRVVADEILRKISISHAQSIKKTPSQQSVSKSRSIKNVDLVRETTLNRNDSNLSSNNKSPTNPLDEATICPDNNNIPESSIIISPVQVVAQNQNVLLNSDLETNAMEKQDDIGIGLGLFDKFYEECLKRIDSDETENDKSNKNTEVEKVNSENTTILENNVPVLDRNNSIIDFDDELKDNFLSGMLFSTPSLENIKNFLEGHSLEESNGNKQDSQCINEPSKKCNEEIKSEVVSGHNEKGESTDSIDHKNSLELSHSNSIGIPLLSSSTDIEKIYFNNNNSNETIESVLLPPPSLDYEEKKNQNENQNEKQNENHNHNENQESPSSSYVKEVNVNVNVISKELEKVKEMPKNDVEKEVNSIEGNTIITSKSSVPSDKTINLTSNQLKNSHPLPSIPIKSSTESTSKQKNEDKMVEESKMVDETKPLEEAKMAIENKIVDEKENNNTTETNNISKPMDNENQNREISTEEKISEDKKDETKKIKEEIKEDSKKETKENSKVVSKEDGEKGDKNQDSDKSQDKNDNDSDSMKKIEVILKKNSDRGNKIILPQSISDINKENKDEKPFIPNKTE
eukprot:jgi/Orpsp1_1/1177437/evm.model.c7180000061445.1